MNDQLEGILSDFEGMHAEIVHLRQFCVVAVSGCFKPADIGGLSQQQLVNAFRKGAVMKNVQFWPHLLRALTVTAIGVSFKSVYRKRQVRSTSGHKCCKHAL